MSDSQIICHTKGSWNIETISDDEFSIVSKNGVTEIASIHYSDGMEKGESLANAALICAAPDLLEAIKILLGHVERSPREFSRKEKIEIALAAIKKAEVFKT